MVLGDFIILIERVGESSFKLVDIHPGQFGDFQKHLHGRSAIAVNPTGKGRALHVEDLSKLYDS